MTAAAAVGAAAAAAAASATAAAPAVAEGVAPIGATGVDDGNVDMDNVDPRLLDADALSSLQVDEVELASLDAQFLLLDGPPCRAQRGQCSLRGPALGFARERGNVRCRHLPRHRRVPGHNPNGNKKCAG